MTTRLLALLLVGFALVLAGCGPKAPDKSMILWEQPAPAIAAALHAKEIGGLVLQIAPTGSMEPFLTGGDYVVADVKFPFDRIKEGDVLIYKARWRPADANVVCHRAAAKSGDEWIMDGIANAHYETGSDGRMGPAEFRGKVVQVYTKRKKS